MRVIATYMVCRQHEKSSDRKFYSQAVGNLIGYLNEYIARDLNLDTRAELRSRYGHHADDAVILKDQPGIKL